MDQQKDAQGQGIEFHSAICNLLGLTQKRIWCFAERFNVFPHCNGIISTQMVLVKAAVLEECGCYKGVFILVILSNLVQGHRTTGIHIHGDRACLAGIRQANGSRRQHQKTQQQG